MKNRFEAFKAAVQEAYSKDCTVVRPAVTYTEERGWHVSSAMHPRLDTDIVRIDAYSEQLPSGSPYATDSITPWRREWEEISRLHKLPA